MDDDVLKEGDVGQTYRCAICGDTIYEWRTDWLIVTLSSKVSMATQNLFVHKSCLIKVIDDRTPLGEVFE